MASEIEIKFVLANKLSEDLLAKVLANINGVIAHSQHDLYNQYYDTPDGLLRRFDSGLRVRGKNGVFEQTLKTSGHSIGGLQNRPEYNIPLDNEVLDVSLFEQQSWPTDFPLAQLIDEVKPQFITHFRRDAYFITLANGSEVELVFDFGTVEAGGHATEICEIELELISGTTDDLFQLSESLVAIIPGRFGFLSKAARGYQLMNHAQWEPKLELEFIKLPTDSTVSEAIVETLSAIIKNWQYHEQCFLQTNSTSAMLAVARELNLLAFSTRYFGELLSSTWLLIMAEQCQQLLAKWQWLEELQVITTLTSSRGIFHKTLQKHSELDAFLSGRKAGLIGPSQCHEILYSSDKNKLQLALLKGIIEQPWLTSGAIAEQPVITHSVACLNAQWQQVFDHFISKQPLTVNAYQEKYHELKRAYLVGVLFAEQFPLQARVEFRAPWIDLLSGIEELHVLNGLAQEIARADITALESLPSWIEDKKQRLLAVLEQTRVVAAQCQPYW